MVRADIQLPQRPAHAQDVNIFPAVHKAIEQIATGPHSDHILLATSTALWLIILPEQEEELDAILQPLLDLGVNISCAAKESPFNHIAFLDSDELKAAESNSHRYYAFPALPAEIGRDICEICQMRAGRQQPPDIDTGIVETLCDSCRSIRQWGNRFRNLGDWSEGQVLWCRMELNSKSLPGHISALYREYLQLLMYAEDGSPVLSQPEQVEDLVQMLQPAALLAEYAQDYRRFLMTFWKRVRNGLDRVQLEANTCLQEISGLDAAVDLFAVKMERHGIAEVILNAFRDSLEEWFPMSAKRGDCPVRLGLSVAHAKHPFFLHWNLLKDLIKTIQFSSAGRPPARMNLQQLGVLQQIAVDIGRSYLYDLAAIERRTGSRLMVEMKIISDRRHRFSEMARRAGIAISDVLVYHAMVNAGGK